MGTQITLLAKNLDCNHLTFLGDTDTAWLKRLNTHKNFHEALQYFVDNKIGKRFNGALQVDSADLPVFIKRLAWLIRTNGVLTDVYFTDPGKNITANICQYGNLHISATAKTADKLLKGIIKQSQFEYLTSGNCYNRYAKRAAIKGRTIKV